MTGHALIVQSGGGTPVINSTLAGLIGAMLDAGVTDRIYGAYRGLAGLLEGDFVDLSALYTSGGRRERLRKTPGAALGTWRHKLDDGQFQKMVDHMRQRNIRHLFYIGGNGSMYAANRLHQAALELRYELTVIGVPKTIDNDLLHTHHTPGYGSAAKFVATCALDCGMDIRSLWDNRKITVLETMGRHTGWLAAAAGLARSGGAAVPQHIYIPETPFDLESFLQDAVSAYEADGYALLVVSEGIRDRDGRIVGSLQETDKVGRPAVGGVSAYLAEQIKRRTSYSARYVVPSIWQRSCMSLASGYDLREAYELGRHAVRLAVRGITGVMLTLPPPSASGAPSADGFGTVPLEAVAAGERSFPLEWYDMERRMVKQPFVDNMLPLIQDSVSPEMRNGLPVYETLQRTPSL